jgi:hypothetical protein
VSEDELSGLHASAAAEGKTLSEWVREKLSLPVRRSQIRSPHLKATLSALRPEIERRLLAGERVAEIMTEMRVGVRIVSSVRRDLTVSGQMPVKRGQPYK